MKKRVGYFGLGPVLVAVLLAFALTDVLWAKLATREKYPDPVVGATIWDAVNKNQDLHALVLLIGSFGVLALGINVLCHQIAPEGSESEVGTTVNQLLLFSMVPSAWRLAVACMNVPDKVPPLRFLSMFPLGAVLCLFLIRRYREQIKPSDVFTAGAAIIVAPIMAGFSALAVVLTITRLIPNSVDRVSHFANGFAAAVIAISIVVVIAIGILSRTIDIFNRRLLCCLMACQALLPLLLFYMVPPPLIDLSKQFANPYPKLLVATLGVVAITCGYLMYRRFRSTAEIPGGALMRAISPISVAMMCIFTIDGTADLPVTWRDYFHSGEMLVPWQQIWDYHSIPYVDFAPIHGLMEIMRGGLNQLFFSGAVGTFPAADFLVAGFALALTAIAASELISPLAAMFLLFAVLPQLDRMYFVAAPLFLIAVPRLLKRPVLWLAIWLVLGLLLSGYNAAMGPAFVIGTFPVAIWQVFRAFRTEIWRLVALAVVAGLFAAFVLAVPQVKQVAMGFITFVLDSQWTNEASNGIAWAQGAGIRDRSWGTGSSQFLWEVVRFGWIPVIIAAAVLFWKQWSKPSSERSLPLMVLAFSVPPVLLVSCLWVIERIDIGVYGRSGALTEVALFMIAPALLFLALPKKHAGISVLALVTILGLVYPNGSPTNIDPQILLPRSFASRVIPKDTAMVDGNKAGLSHLGQVIKPDPDFTAQIIELKTILSGWLKPGETYFDMCDSGAIYYYLDLPCPAQYQVYVAGNAKLQAVMMRQLQKHPVPVVLLSPGGGFDNAPLSLRCYRPYREYVLRYPCIEQGDYIFLVDPKRFPNAGPVGSESQLAILDQLYKKENLLRLPMVWGDSWASMKDRFTMIAHDVTAQPLKPAATWPIPPDAATGAIADFLRFHLDFVPVDPGSYKIARRNWAGVASNNAEPQIALTWTNADGSQSAPILFKAQTGDMVIPLGTYPRWLLGSGFRTITLTVQNPMCVKEMTASDLEFMHLKPL